MSTGLRERRKEEIRQKLSRAAIELFLLHGFENITVDQIVEPLGVSRRTFFRHFATKEDLVFVWYEDLTSELVSACVARPAGEAPYVSICAALRGLLAYYEDNPSWGLAMLRLTAETASLVGKSLEKRAMWQEALAEAVEGKMEGHPNAALLSRIVAGAAVNAFAFGVDIWFRGVGDGSLHAVVDAAFSCAGNVAAFGTTAISRPDQTGRGAPTGKTA